MTWRNINTHKNLEYADLNAYRFYILTSELDGIQNHKQFSILNLPVTIRFCCADYWFGGFWFFSKWVKPGVDVKLCLWPLPGKHRRCLRSLSHAGTCVSAFPLRAPKLPQARLPWQKRWNFSAVKAFSFRKAAVGFYPQSSPQCWTLRSFSTPNLRENIGTKSFYPTERWWGGGVSPGDTRNRNRVTQLSCWFVWTLKCATQNN